MAKKEIQDTVIDKGYLNNPRLKKIGTDVNFTEEQVQEYLKCEADPVYFIEKYVKIINVDRGLIPFEMYDFQKRAIRTIHENRFVITKWPRQSGKSVTLISYFLYLILFNENINIAILANKGQLANELLGRLKLAYEHIPLWLQQGIKTWNVGDIEVENGSKVKAAATSSSAIRGLSYNIIMLDEFAHVPNHLAEEFFNSTYPTISSGTTTKVLMISTPKGMNMFYKLWTDAIEGNNQYVPLEAFWNDVPGRDEKFKQDTIRNTSQLQWDQEFACVKGDTEILIFDNIEKKEKKIKIEDLYENL